MIEGPCEYRALMRRFFAFVQMKEVQLIKCLLTFWTKQLYWDQIDVRNASEGFFVIIYHRYTQIEE